MHHRELIQSSLAVLARLSFSHPVPMWISFSIFSALHFILLSLHLLSPRHVYTPNGIAADPPLIQLDGLLIDEVADCSVFPGDPGSGYFSWLSE